MQKIKLTQADIQNNPLLESLGARAGDEVEITIFAKEEDGEERGAPPVDGPGGSTPPGKP